MSDWVSDSYSLCWTSMMREFDRLHWSPLILSRSVWRLEGADDFFRHSSCRTSWGTSEVSRFSWWVWTSNVSSQCLWSSSSIVWGIGEIYNGVPVEHDYVSWIEIARNLDTIFPKEISLRFTWWDKRYTDLRFIVVKQQSCLFHVHFYKSGSMCKVEGDNERSKLSTKGSIIEEGRDIMSEKKEHNEMERTQNDETIVLYETILMPLW